MPAVSYKILLLCYYIVIDDVSDTMYIKNKMNNKAKLYKRCSMLNKITTADARKKFASIINRVAFGKESFLLTRRGEPLAAIVTVEDLKLLHEMEEQMDIDDAWKARKEPGENVSWEQLREELGL